MTLDAIRGVAAVIVVTRHTPRFFGGEELPLTWLAVDLFFLLSGFVLAHAYDRRLAANMTSTDFMTARAVRLWPIYALGLGLGTVAAATPAWVNGQSQGLSLAGVAASAGLGVFFLPTFWGATGTLFPLNFPAWSLLLELIVNALHAVFFRARRIAPAALFTILGAVGIVTACASATDLSGGYQWSTVVPGLARATFAFFAGVLLFRHRPNIALKSSFATIVLVALAAAFLCAPVEGRFERPFSLLALFAIFPAIVVMGSLVEPKGIAVPKICAILGIVSYPVYMLHEPLQKLLYGISLRCGIDLRDYAPWSGVIFILLLLPLGFYVSQFYEIRARNMLANAARRWRGSAEPVLNQFGEAAQR